MSGAAGPPIQALVRQTSSALAQLDAVRLEELVQACQALEEAAVPAAEAGEVAAELAVLARVLQATSENLRVMERLRELRLGHIEYSERAVAGSAAESTDGHD